MVKFETLEKDFTYLGLKYRLQTITFRMKDFDKVLEISNNWMKEHYGSKFVEFEFRSDLGNAYIARMNDFGNISGTHLNDSCSIGKIGTQWRANLAYRKPIF